MESSEVLYDPEQHDPGIRLWAVLPDPAPSARADGGQLAAGQAPFGGCAASVLCSAILSAPAHLFRRLNARVCVLRVYLENIRSPSLALNLAGGSELFAYAPVAPTMMVRRTVPHTYIRSWHAGTSILARGES